MIPDDYNKIFLFFSSSLFLNKWKNECARFFLFKNEQMRTSVDHISNQPRRRAKKVLLWSVLILSSNWLRWEIDRGLITVVFEIIVVTRVAVGVKINRVGLAIIINLLKQKNKKKNFTSVCESEKSCCLITFFFVCL
jgi:hypothetical protein